jgi:lysophospholipase L1-like esterase
VIRKALTVTLALVAAQVAAVVVGAHASAWYFNSLEGGGRWIASKSRLERHVMASRNFASSHHTLSGEHLDLGRWFGFQEVLLAEPVPTREVAFDFRPSTGAYLVFLYGLGPEGGRGLRLSTAERFPSGLLTIGPGGEFLAFERMPALDVRARAWSHLQVEFAPAGAVARLDGGAPQPIAPAPELQRFGFRNGLSSVLIDDVRCEGEGGFHESFFNAACFRRALLALPLVLALDVVLWRFLRRRLPVERVLRLALKAAVFLVATALGGAYLQRQVAGRYPRKDHTSQAAWLDREAADVTQRIEASHGKREPGRTRILVVGTSQTWGAGAARAEDGMVEVLERLLAAAEPERRWECINAGVQGLRSDRLLQLLRERWIALEPDALVVNLSNNDRNAEVFSRSLHGFAELAAERGLPVLFALEANSTERAPGALPMHATMRRVAEEHAIPVVDVHAAVGRQYERGFLWWDPVHPTSLGHRLIAETLLPAVRALVASP